MNIANTIVRFIILLLLLFSLGCHPANDGGSANSQDNARATRSSDAGRAPDSVDKSKLPTANTPYIKIYVAKSGEITLDDKPATLDEVKSALAALAQKSGVVLYTRESPEEFEPHPNGNKIVEMIVENRLPVRLCRNKDFSDAIGPDGKLLGGN